MNAPMNPINDGEGDNAMTENNRDAKKARRAKATAADSSATSSTVPLDAASSPLGASPPPVANRGPSRRTAKRDKFVAAFADPTVKTATEAARIAGYGHPRHRSAELMAIPEVREAIQARQTEAMRLAGVDAVLAWKTLRHAMEDSDGSWKRAPAVRASELTLRAAHELEEPADVVNNLVLPNLSLSEIRAALESRGPQDTATG